MGVVENRNSTSSCGWRREVFFETNGVPRMVEVEDRRQAAADAVGAAGSKRASRERADPSQLGSVASPMSGEIIEIVAKPGEIEI